jgi:hypothetical protein
MIFPYRSVAPKNPLAIPIFQLLLDGAEMIRDRLPEEQGAVGTSGEQIARKECESTWVSAIYRGGTTVAR